MQGDDGRFAGGGGLLLPYLLAPLMKRAHRILCYLKSHLKCFERMNIYLRYQKGPTVTFV